ncbi:MAG: hypothetical protein ABUS79_16680 [Pseudomonadota bacterium]
MTIAVVRRTLASRRRLGQTFTPVAMILGVVARRTDSVPAYVVAGAAVLLAAVAVLSARRTFRHVEIRAEHKHITAILGREPVSISAVSSWTMDGTIAHVYDPFGGWSLQDSDNRSLAALLTGACGAPLALRRRGSDRARYAALSVACAGALSPAAGFGAERVLLVIAGIPLFGIGAAVFGALSQKVIDGTARPSTSPNAPQCG